MPSTVTVTLGDTDFTVRRFNIGQLEELSELMTGEMSGRKLSFEILRRALKNASPPVDDVNSIEMDLEQMRVASRQIMELAGIKQDPPKPEATAGET